MSTIFNLVPVPDPSRAVPGKQISFPLSASRRNQKFDGNEKVNDFKSLSNLHRFRSRVGRE